MNTRLFSVIVRYLELGPRTVERLVSSLGPGSHDLRRVPDRFSVREVLAHLADTELIHIDRMRIALAAPGSPVESWDEERAVIDNDYASKDPGQSLGLWKMRRAETLALLAPLSSEDLGKTVMHPGLKEMSISDIACFMVAHDIYHVEQLTTYLK